MSSTSVPGNSTFVPKMDQGMQVVIKELPNTDLLEMKESSSSIDSSVCNRCDSPNSIPSKREKAKEDLKYTKDFDCSIENPSGSVLTHVTMNKVNFQPDNKCDNAMSKLESRATGATARYDQTQYRPPNVSVLNNETHIPKKKYFSSASGGINNWQNSDESNKSLQIFSGNDNNSDGMYNINSEEGFSTPLCYGYSGSNFVLPDLFGSLFDNNGRELLPYDSYPDAENNALTGKREKAKKDLKYTKDFDCSIENPSGSVLTHVTMNKVNFQPDNKCDNAMSKLESRATGATARYDQTQYRPPNVSVLNNETHIPTEKDFSSASGGINNWQNSDESNKSLQIFSGNDNNSDGMYNINSEEGFSTPLCYGYSGSNFVLPDLFGSLFDNNGRDLPPYDSYPDAENNALTGKREKAKEDLKYTKDFDCSIENPSGSVLTHVTMNKVNFQPDNKCDNAMSKLESRATGATARYDQTQYRPPNVSVLNNETHIPKEKDFSSASGGINNWQNSDESNKSLQIFSGNDNNSDGMYNINSEEGFSTPLCYGYSGSNFVLPDLFGSLFDNNGRYLPPYDSFPDAENNALTGNNAFQSANENESGCLKPEANTLSQCEEEIYLIPSHISEMNSQSSFSIDVQEPTNLPTNKQASNSSLGIQNDIAFCSERMIQSPSRLNFNQADPDFTTTSDTYPPIMDHQRIADYIISESTNKNVSPDKVCDEQSDVD
ncbi:hypothetical protein TNCV_4873761 [Trichonephila clavipes]|nr:hypothetical protein TNCV_4873761 [Trichonephila clavipes]